MRTAILLAFGRHSRSIAALSAAVTASGPSPLPEYKRVRQCLSPRLPKTNAPSRCILPLEALLDFRDVGRERVAVRHVRVVLRRVVTANTTKSAAGPDRCAPASLRVQVAGLTRARARGD